MKKRHKLFLVTVFILFIPCFCYYFYIVKGGPIRKTLSINNCSTNYTHYLTNNEYQMQKTYGHTENNELSLISARLRIMDCLCDNFIRTKEYQDSIQIINFLLSPEYEKFKDFFHVSPIQFNIDTLKVYHLCQNKEQYFSYLILD